jgi:hypothetical protein
VSSWRGGSDLAGACGVLPRAFWVLVGVCGSLGARTRRIACLCESVASRSGLTALIATPSSDTDSSDNHKT